MRCACSILSSVDPDLQHFPTLSHKEKRKEKLNMKCVFLVSPELLSYIFFILRRTERDTMGKNILVFIWSTRYSCPILNKLEFSRQIFEKSSKTKFRQNQSGGNQVIPSERTNGRIDITKPIAAFRNFAKNPKNWLIIALLNRRWNWDTENNVWSHNLKEAVDTIFHSRRAKNCPLLTHNVDVCSYVAVQIKISLC